MTNGLKVAILAMLALLIVVLAGVAVNSSLSHQLGQEAVSYQANNTRFEDSPAEASWWHPMTVGTWALVLSTIALVVGTFYLGFVTYQAANAFRVAERAYVKLSHMPPGIEFDPLTGFFTIRLRIKNFGSTPAEVVDAHVVGVVVPKGVALPEQPDDRREEGYQFPVTAFLVKSDRFYFGRPDPLSVSAEEAHNILQGWMDLHVIGYVDYRDRFGEVHRAGYARTYIPSVDRKEDGVTLKKFRKRNNLAFISEPGLNYDRLLRESERDEWTKARKHRSAKAPPGPVSSP